jgi:hypothetical protein|tara:strand:+ start:1327 stop:1629 length:303 start_codon:yes stop_codon:yes gene_type:complete
MAWTQITEYNMSSFEGVRDFIVENSLGYFGIMLLIAIFVIFTFFYWLGSKDILGSFGVGGFAMFTLGLLLWIYGFISVWVFTIVFAIAILTWIGLFTPRN